MNLFWRQEALWAWKRFAQEEAAACPTLTRIACALGTSRRSLLPSDCWKQLHMLGRAYRPPPLTTLLLLPTTQHTTHTCMHACTVSRPQHYHTHTRTNRNVNDQRKVTSTQHALSYYHTLLLLSPHTHTLYAHYHTLSHTAHTFLSRTSRLSTQPYHKHCFFIPRLEDAEDFSGLDFNIIQEATKDGTKIVDRAQKNALCLPALLPDGN